MPVKKTVRHNTEEVAQQTAVDCGGSELLVGDYVTLRLRVTNIRPIIGNESGVEERQDLELGRVIPVNENHPDSDVHKEYVQHFMVCDSSLCSKSE